MAGSRKRSGKRKTTALPPQGGAGAERRSAYRYRCSLEASCSLITLQRNRPRWPVQVRDISCTGISLVVRGVVTVGTFLSIALPTRDGQPRLLRACVVRIRRIGPRLWEFGCTLQPNLSKEEIETIV